MSKNCFTVGDWVKVDLPGSLYHGMTGEVTNRVLGSSLWEVTFAGKFIALFNGKDLDGVETIPAEDYINEL